MCVHLLLEVPLGERDINNFSFQILCSFLCFSAQCQTFWEGNGVLQSTRWVASLAGLTLPSWGRQRVESLSMSRKGPVAWEMGSVHSSEGLFMPPPGQRILLASTLWAFIFSLDRLFINIKGASILFILQIKPRTWPLGVPLRGLTLWDLIRRKYGFYSHPTLTATLHYSSMCYNALPSSSKDSGVIRFSLGCQGIAHLHTLEYALIGSTAYTAPMPPSLGFPLRLTLPQLFSSMWWHLKGHYKKSN